jgi:GGDEF domain-containing protein
VDSSPARRSPAQPETAGDDPVAALHATVHSYLSTLLSVAECLGSACPPVGGPYQHRLSRLEKRLAFDSSQEAVEESCEEVARQLKDYSAKASAYLRSHGVELRRAVAGLDEIVRGLAQRHDFYAARLHQLAAQMETAPYPGDPLRFSEAVALQSAGLKTCVDSMFHESQSMVTRMREELGMVERRLAESEITDPVTGLTNQREMERRIREETEAGKTPVLIRFDLGDPIPDQVARQVGARIGSQFRYNDLVCRWSDHEFLVLFQSTAEIARTRLGQVVPWVAGRYQLDNGEIANIRAEACLVDGGMEGLEALAALPKKPVASSA